MIKNRVIEFFSYRKNFCRILQIKKFITNKAFNNCKIDIVKVDYAFMQCGNEIIVYKVD